MMWRATVTTPRPVDDSLAMLRLDGRADVRVRALSGGEQRRLDLACTLMGHPDVVLLDEPTTGLDPESRRDVWRLIRGLRDEGTTVLLTTHYLEEAEALADRLEIMHAGRIVRSGTPAVIAADHPSTISFATLPELPWLPDLDARRVIEERGITTIETDDLQAVLTDLLTRAVAPRRTPRGPGGPHREPRVGVPRHRRRLRVRPPSRDTRRSHPMTTHLADPHRRPRSLQRRAAGAQPAGAGLRAGAAARAARPVVRRRAR